MRCPFQIVHRTSRESGGYAVLFFSHGRRNSVSFIRKEKPLRHIPRAAVLAGLRHPGRRSPAVERGAHHRPSGLRPSGAGRRLDVAGAYGKRHSGKMVQAALDRQYCRETNAPRLTLIHQKRSPPFYSGGAVLVGPSGPISKENHLSMSHLQKPDR